MIRKYFVIAVVLIAVMAVFSVASYGSCGSCGAGSSQIAKADSPAKAGVKKIGEVYRCGVCGNEVSVAKVGGGELTCCGHSMILMQEGK